MDCFELIMGIGFGENIINSFKIDEGGEVREKIMKKIREGKCGSFLYFLVLWVIFDWESNGCNVIFCCFFLVK